MMGWVRRGPVADGLGYCFGGADDAQAAGVVNRPLLPNREYGLHELYIQQMQGPILDLGSPQSELAPALFLLADQPL